MPRGVRRIRPGPRCPLAPLPRIDDADLFRQTLGDIVGNTFRLRVTCPKACVLRSAVELVVADKRLLLYGKGRSIVSSRDELRRSRSGSARPRERRSAERNSCASTESSTSPTPAAASARSCGDARAGSVADRLVPPSAAGDTRLIWNWVLDAPEGSPTNPSLSGSVSSLLRAVPAHDQRIEDDNVECNHDESPERNSVPTGESDRRTIGACSWACNIPFGLLASCARQGCGSPFTRRVWAHRRARS